MQTFHHSPGAGALQNTQNRRRRIHRECDATRRKSMQRVNSSHKSTRRKSMQHVNLSHKSDAKYTEKATLLDDEATSPNLHNKSMMRVNSPHHPCFATQKTEHLVPGVPSFSQRVPSLSDPNPSLSHPTFFPSAWPLASAKWVRNWYALVTH